MLFRAEVFSGASYETIKGSKSRDFRKVRTYLVQIQSYNVRGVIKR